MKFVENEGKLMSDTTDTKLMAAEIFSKAWRDAADKGIPNEMIASTALSASYASLVKIHGPEATAKMAERFAKAILDGKFGH